MFVEFAFFSMVVKYGHIRRVEERKILTVIVMAVFVLNPAPGAVETSCKQMATSRIFRPLGKRLYRFPSGKRCAGNGQVQSFEFNLETLKKHTARAAVFRSLRFHGRTTTAKQWAFVFEKYRVFHTRSIRMA